jgi:hypothetical protein
MTFKRTTLLATTSLLLALGAAGAAVAQAPPPPPNPPGVPAPPPAAAPQAATALTSTAIGRMQPGYLVVVKGSVAEIFGNKFILQDDTGRALVELGPRGDGIDAVAKGEPVTVQGQFDEGFIHAQIVSHADGRNQVFGPPPPPRPPRDADRRPDGGRRPPLPPR